jgi:translation initiation factor 5A
MSDDGSTKDDVKIPDGDVGDKIKKMFVDDGKDTSKLLVCVHSY